MQFFERELAEADGALQTGRGKYQEMYLAMLQQRREWLHLINAHAEFDEEIIRKYIGLTDMEEFYTRQHNLLEKEMD